MSIKVVASDKSSVKRTYPCNAADSPIFCPSPFFNHFFCVHLHQTSGGDPLQLPIAFLERGHASAGTLQGVFVIGKRTVLSAWARRVWSLNTTN